MTPSSLQIPQQFFSVIGVGTPQAVFQPKAVSKWSGLVIGLLMLGAAGIGFIVGAYMTYANYTKYGSATLSKQLSDIFLPTVIVTGILFLIGLAALWGAFSKWRKAAVVYENGLGYCDRKGVRTLRWEQIAGITAAVTKHYYNGIYTGTTHVYTLWDQKGEKLILNDEFPKVEELADLVEKNIYPLLYQAAADRYNAGHKVQFGPVTISKAEGIAIKKKAYAWNEVAEVSVKQGILKIAKKGGGWFSGENVTVAVIPNYKVLFSIINQVVGLKAG